MQDTKRVWGRAVVRGHHLGTITLRRGSESQRTPMSQSCGKRGKSSQAEGTARAKARDRAASSTSEKKKGGRRVTAESEEERNVSCSWRGRKGYTSRASWGRSALGSYSASTLLLLPLHWGCRGRCCIGWHFKPEAQILMFNYLISKKVYYRALT